MYLLWINRILYKNDLQSHCVCTYSEFILIHSGKNRKFCRVQGVPTRYDILWSPRWPTKVDFQVLKKVAAPLGDVDIWVLSIYFQKSMSAGLYGLWQKNCQVSVKIWIFEDPTPKKGQVLVIWVSNGDEIIKIRKFFGEKGLLRSSRPLRFLRLPMSMRLHRSLRPEKWLMGSLESTRSLDLIIQCEIFWCLKYISVGRIIKYQTEFWYPFLSEAVEASQCYFFENRLIKL